MFGNQELVLRFISEPVGSELASLEEELDGALVSEIPFVDEICRYIAAARGKRLRPIVLFLTARSLGAGGDAVVSAGAAVELVHTATLIHDDIIDGHMLRRGKPTVNAEWGDNVATIMGDFLYSKAFAMLAERGQSELLGILSRVTHVMSAGEMLQFQQKLDINVDEGSYMDMISKKTASLFSASCECGAVLGAGDSAVRASYAGFGESMGLAFQITDDLFDYIAVESMIGKPTGSDIASGRVTLPFIAAFRNAPARERERVEDLFRVGFYRDENWGAVVTFVQRFGGIEYSIRRAKELGEDAKSRLSGIEPSRERDALAAAADYVVSRTSIFTG